MTTENERHSAPVRRGALPPLTQEQKAHQEAQNTLLQYDRMKELIDSSLANPQAFRLRPHLIQDLNRLSIQRIESEAGRWRDVEMRIEQSRHTPPLAVEVPRYVDEMCDYVNDNWNQRTAVHLAAYVMWRLNWIHPFIDGNGRTTRAVSYYVLCAKLGFRIPGVKTIPELIAQNKKPYYDALESADEHGVAGRVDVTAMENILKDLVARQTYDALEQNQQTDRRGVQSNMLSQQSKTTSNNDGVGFNTRVGVVAGFLALGFFMTLVLLPIFGRPIPPSAKIPMVIVLALSGAMSASYIGGNAIARGSIPIAHAEQHSVSYAVTGGIAVLVLLLIIGWKLFL